VPQPMGSAPPTSSPMCSRRRPSYLPRGGVGQVGALHPGAGAPLKGLLAPLRVDLGATPEVGLDVGEPCAGVGVGGECPLGLDAPAVVLVIGAVTL
jgi:hypothetical protein